MTSKFKIICLFLCVFVIGLFPSVPGGCKEQAEQKATPETMRSELDRLVTPLIKQNKSMGIVVGIYEEGRREVFGYGRISKQNSHRPEGDTLYEIGSITKVFTTMLLLDQVEQGRMKLDASIQTYLPAEVKAPRYETMEINLIHLATHTSGLPRMPDNFIMLDPWNPYIYYNEALLYWFLSHHTLKRKPGEDYLYSNVGMGTLGHLLTRRTGREYEALLVERICDRLEMPDTRITLTDSMRQRLAPGYTSPGLWMVRVFRPIRNWDFDVLASAGAIRSTGNDMLTFLAANLEEGKTALSQIIQKSHKVRYTVDEWLQIGLGWHILRMDGEEVIWHNGMTGGYSSFLGMVEKYRSGMVVLSNTNTSVDSLALEILSCLIERHTRK